MPIQRSIVSATTNFGLRRRDVAKQDVGRFAIAFRQLRLEFLENVQRHRKRLAIVHVLLVFARPAKGLARRDFKAGQVDLAIREKLPVLGREIVANDPDQVDRAEKAGRNGGIRRRTAEQLVMLRRGGLDVIERDGANDEYGHK